MMKCTGQGLLKCLSIGWTSLCAAGWGQHLSTPKNCIMTSWEILWDCVGKAYFMEDMAVWTSTAHGGARLSHPEGELCEEEKHRKSQRRMLGSDFPWGPC